MMAKTEIVYLSEEDVMSTGLSLSQTMDLCFKSLTQHGKKQVENPPKPGVHPRQKAFIHAMPAWLKESDMCGIKWVSGFPSNGFSNMPTIAGLIVLNDTTTGFPLAIMDATHVTALRTAAVSGIYAGYLARKDSDILAIVGTGTQAKFNAITLTHVLPSIKTIRVFSKVASNIDQFVTQMNKFFEDRGKAIKIDVSSSIKEALTGADVIVTTTNKVDHDTWFFAECIKPGSLVLPIHSRFTGFEKDIMSKMDMVVVDDWVQFHSFAKAEYDVPEKPHAELGEIVTHVKSGRTDEKQRIIAFNTGLAIHDIIVASEVLKIANQKSLGKMLLYKTNLGQFQSLPNI